MSEYAREVDAFTSSASSKKSDVVESIPFGIDLGTTNSSISCGLKNHAAENIVLKSGKLTMPSVVMWLGGDNWVVGDEAYKYAHQGNPNVCTSVKSKMQDPTAMVVFEYNGERVVKTPTEVSAMILKGIADQTKGYEGKVRDVVVTVPAKFDNVGVENTKKACALAGMNCLYILREPTSAAMCYNLDETQMRSSYNLVFDFGGGTFDVSLVHATDTGLLRELYDLYGIECEDLKEGSKLVEPINVDGDTALGGDDFDKSIVEILYEKLQTLGVDVEDLDQACRASLISKAESYKHCSKGQVILSKIPIWYEGQLREDATEFEVKITTDDVEKAFVPLYKRLLKITENVIMDSRVPIYSLILVGNSCRYYALKEWLARDLKKYEIIVDDSSVEYEPVARGAGIMSKGILYGDTDIIIHDVLPLTIGIYVDGKVQPIFSKKSTIPASVMESFTNSYDDQDLIILDLYQQSSCGIGGYNRVGQLVIDKVPAVPKGSIDISAEFTIDADCVMHCEVLIRSKKDFETGKLINPTLEPIRRSLLINLNASASEDKIREAQEKELIKNMTKDEKRIYMFRKSAENMSPKNREEFLYILDNIGSLFTLDDAKRFANEHRTKITR